jgi:K(+)-stimulated pyrophosphate-energized sodium pump
MNILIKLMSIVSLVIAPTLAQISNAKKSDAAVSQKNEIKPVAVVTKSNSANTVQYK